MSYYKINNFLVLIITTLVLGCSPSSDEEITTISLNVTNFETSYEKVKIEWELQRSNNVIIQDLLVYRTSLTNNQFEQAELIANLPSNQTSFLDIEVPYLSDITYTIKINYFIDKKLAQGEYHEILTQKSDPQLFHRDIIHFDKIPLQVKKDPRQDGIYHILDRSGNGQLLKYDSNQNTRAVNVSFENSLYYSIAFHIINETQIYVTDTKGKFKIININNYETTDQFDVEIVNDLKAFTVAGSRLYYFDKDELKYFDLNNRESMNTHWAYFPNIYAEALDGNKLLFLSRLYGSVTDISESNCPNANNCWPEKLYETDYSSNIENHFDPFILTWNTGKTKFISSYYGDIYDISDLSKIISLKEITGKNYFQFAFDNDNNIYATVQGEKLIHVFNENYELINAIHTKLYPIFPMLDSNNKIYNIGSYEPIGYWGYYYGYEFNFSNNCAIELYSIT